MNPIKIKPININHTMALFKIIKKDLIRFKIIVSYISMFVFSLYYIVKVVLNFYNITLFIVNSTMFLTLILAFVIENVIKEKENVTTLEAKEIKERQQNVLHLLKVLNYLAKSVLVGFAIYDLISYPIFDFQNFLNFLSIVILIIQLISEFIINIILKYFEYLSFAIKLDYEDSYGVKLLHTVIAHKNKVNKNLDDKIIELQGQEKYTEREQKIIDKLKDSAVECEKTRKEKLKQDIKNKKNKIKELLKERKNNNTILSND